MEEGYFFQYYTKIRKGGTKVLLSGYKKLGIKVGIRTVMMLLLPAETRAGRNWLKLQHRRLKLHSLAYEVIS